MPNDIDLAAALKMLGGMNINPSQKLTKEKDLQEAPGNAFVYNQLPISQAQSIPTEIGITPEMQGAASSIPQLQSSAYKFQSPEDISTLGIIRDYFKESPKTQPQTGTQIADENFNQAVINEQNRAMIQQLGYFKNIYDSAPKGIQGDLLRNYSSSQADALRKTAQQLGIDLGAWGDGGTGISTQDSNVAIMRDRYEQAKAAQEKFQSVQDDLKNKYGMSSQEYYDERYDYYRSRGVPHAMAVLRAGRETVPYAKERTGFLQNAIDEYGIDNGTVLNQFGVGVLGQLATEDSILGTAIANAYDMPKKLGEYNRAIQQMAITQGYNLDRMEQQARLTNWLNGENWLRSEDTAENSIDRTVRQHDKIKDIDFKYAKQMSDYNKSIADKTVTEQIELRKKLCAELGIPEEIAKYYILTGNIISNKSKNGKNGVGSDYDKDRLDGLYKTANSLSTQIKNEEERLLTISDPNEYNQAQSRIAQMRSQLSKTYDAMNILNGTALESGDYVKAVLNGRTISGNWNNDAPIVSDFNEFFYSLGASNPEYKSLLDYANRQKAVKKLLMEYGYSEENANRAVGINTKPATKNDNQQNVKKESTNQNKNVTKQNQKNDATKEPKIDIFNPSTGQRIIKY